MANPNRSTKAGRMAVAAVFPDRDAAERAVRALKDAGFAGDQIGVAMRDRTAQGQLIGGVLGGILGLLVGAGALVIPGIGPVVAGGALAAALGTAGATAVAGAGVGAAAGGVIGALVNMGIPEERARYFETTFRTGGVIVTVYDTGNAERARQVLEQYGGDTGMKIGSTTSTTTTRRM
jgi:hypothetical protein